MVYLRDLLVLVMRFSLVSIHNRSDSHLHTNVHTQTKIRTNAQQRKISIWKLFRPPKKTSVIIYRSREKKLKGYYNRSFTSKRLDQVQNQIGRNETMERRQQMIPYILKGLKRKRFLSIFSQNFSVLSREVYELLDGLMFS